MKPYKGREGYGGPTSKTCGNRIGRSRNTRKPVPKIA